MGSKAKEWLADPEGNAWLFKRVRVGDDKRRGVRTFGEDRTEKVAAECASALAVPAATIELASRRGPRCHIRSRSCPSSAMTCQTMS